jgi:allantoinase
MSGKRALLSTRVVLPHGVEPAVVHVEADGRIGEIAVRAAPGYEVSDYGELALSPGLVDCHIHVNEPGRTEWEGFATATRAAAAGGVTTVVDMPLNSIPATTSAAALARKKTACFSQCFVDVGFWGGVIPGNAGELEGLARAGALGCKTFMIESGVDEFPCSSRDDLRAAMPILRQHGLPLLAHAELDLGADVREPDPRRYDSYLQSRPPAWEEAAIAMLIELARETGCHVHVVHLSAAASLAAISAAKAEGLPLSVETCPHYLCLEAEEIPDDAVLYKCSPPIREHQNREQLWRGLLDDVIDFVVTDHSPCTPYLKHTPGGLHDAWGGIASLQLGLPLLWTEARARGADLSQLARWTSSRAARFAGVDARKGSIATGLDADLVVWDPEATTEVTVESLFFRHRQQSPYIGASVHGRVRHTWLRGVEIFDGAAPVGMPRGRLLLGRDRALGTQASTGP